MELEKVKWERQEYNSRDIGYDTYIQMLELLFYKCKPMPEREIAVCSIVSSEDNYEISVSDTKKNRIIGQAIWNPRKNIFENPLLPGIWFMTRIKKKKYLQVVKTYAKQLEGLKEQYPVEKKPLTAILTQLETLH